MTNISKFLVKEGILTAETLDDKLSAVARAVSRCIDSSSDGILYETQVQKALTQLRKQEQSFLKETHPQLLAKPDKNPHYASLGVRYSELQDAISNVIEVPTQDTVVEMQYKHRDVGMTQSFYNRIILFKEDDRLKQYLLSHLSGPVCTKIVYAFSVPNSLLNIREGSVRAQSLGLK